MKFVKISDEELHQINRLYESVMSYASHGLFFREGESVGKSIARIARTHPEKDYFHIAGEVLRGRGWVDRITFVDTPEEKKAIAEGSIEGESGKGAATCHRLRGIIKTLYEEKYGKPMRCQEIACISKGDQKCVFKIEEVFI